MDDDIGLGSVCFDFSRIAALLKRQSVTESEPISSPTNYPA